ncbi:MAG: TIGR01777 family protein [Planctomycetota bacterium]|nr:MAG: TIGR01777 family protein [Planctomycetota bacterium]
MRVVLSGATGLIGRALGSRLAAKGHTCVALSRDPARARSRLPWAASVGGWVAAAGPPRSADLAGCGAVVHLAGEPVAGRWTRRKRRALRESRVLGTRHLVQCLGALSWSDRPALLVAASAMGYYGDRGEEVLDEGSGPGGDFLAELCRAWEAEAQAAAALGVRVVRLRLGLVLDSGGGALGAMLRPFRLGLGGPLGSGRQWWSWIHHEDLLAVCERALEGALPEVVNAVAPGAVRQAEFASTLGRVLGRPAFLPVPAAALRVVLGGFACELLSSRRLRPRALEEAGLRFAHPALEGALRDLFAVGGKRTRGAPPGPRSP